MKKRTVIALIVATLLIAFGAISVVGCKSSTDIPQANLAPNEAANSDIVIVNSNTDPNSKQVAIDLDDAKKIATDHAGVDVSAVTFVKIKLKKDDGLLCYEIKFVTAEVTYDYEIDANSGAILEFDYEHIESNSTVNPPVQEAQLIGIERAKEIALNHANLNENAVVITEARQSRDNGVVVYDVEFFCEGVEYDYEIDAITGEIREYSSEQEKQASVPTDKPAEPKPTNKPAEPKSTNKPAEPKPTNKPTEPKPSNKPADEYIGIAKAKSIALSHAKVSASQVTFTKAKLDRDDGRMIYEIEFFVGRVEYDYEIDALTGKILEWDKDYDD